MSALHHLPDSHVAGADIGGHWREQSHQVLPAWEGSCNMTLLGKVTWIQSRENTFRSLPVPALLMSL